MRQTLAALLIVLALLVSPSFGQSTKVETRSAALSGGAFSYTTTGVGAGTTGCLTHVSVNFSPASTGAETVSVFLTSRNGAAGNSLIGKAQTVASTTTNLTFLFANSVPLNSGDQIKITTTAVAANATVTATVWADTGSTPCVGNGVSILRDGVVISSTRGSGGGSSASATISAVGNCSAGSCATEGGTDIFPFIYEGTANNFETTFSATDPTADRTITFPDLTGTVLLNNGIGDDKTIIGDSASAYTWRSIPDCLDSAGNHLNYTASTNTLSCGTSATSNTHSILSATHTDTTAAVVVRGDLITGQAASPLWKRLALGAQYKVASSDGTDVAWDAVHLDQSAAVTGILPSANGGTDVSTHTDDAVLLGNGSVYQSKVIGDCQDTTGKHLNYTASTNAFSCGTSITGAAPAVWSGGTNASALSTTLVNYFSPMGNSTPNATESVGGNQFMVPYGGNVSHLCCELTGNAGAGGSGKSYTLALSVNSSVTSTPVCAVIEVATTCCDNSTSFPVVAGNKISVKSTPANTPTGGRAATCGFYLN